MKKSIFTIVLAIIFTSTFAGKSIKTTDYIITDNGIEYVTKVKVGYDNNLIVIKETGEKVSYMNAEVKAYRKNGKEFKNLIYVEEGSYFVQKTFMQRLFSRAGYSIYKKANSFYVYFGEQLELKINKENYKVILKFFFPKFNLLYSK